MRLPAALSLGVVWSLALVGLPAPPAAAQGASVHVVQPGQTLYRIALRYGVTVDALAAANGIADPARIRAGQVLRIPLPRPAAARVSPHASAPVAGRASTSGPRASVASVEVRHLSVRYTVSRGDTLSGIARRFGTSVQALRSANGLRSDLIRPGQRLVIPRARIVVRIPPPGPTVRVRVPPPPVPAVGAEVPDPDVGDRVFLPRPLRVRRGPATYFTTVAVAAAQTPVVVVGRQDGWYEVELPDGTTGWIRQADFSAPPPAPAGAVAGADVVVREALQYLGTRYVWGGSSADGVDCSGFVYLVFSAYAPELARLRSFDYFRLGLPVSQAQLRPGDLVFFTTYAPGPSHVGIYVGDRRFIHASSSVRQVTLSSLDDPYYAARYVGARRLAP
jgi:cell wall-associated NlpC family hydrolase/LysM repeat protein